MENGLAIFDRLTPLALRTDGLPSLNVTAGGGYWHDLRRTDND